MVVADRCDRSGVSDMNIWMMTNTYTPFVGGVARSVTAFTRECRKAGHRVLVVAPVYEGAPKSEEDVVRIPAIQDFNGSDFSVALPVPGYLTAYFDECRPDVVHSHHPHLLGNTAVRIASRFSRPLVFTHHTMYEQYLHYVPAEAARMREFVIALVTGYCNLCDCIIAPSQSVAEILRERGVESPIEIIPTGVDVRAVREGRRRGVSLHCAGFRGRPSSPATWAGWRRRRTCRSWRRRCGRLPPGPKNGHFLVVGSGPSANEIKRVFREAGLRRRLHLVGSLEGQDLVDAYHAMDVFVFASRSETQGMVLTEAMAAGKPVVALDAPGGAGGRQRQVQRTAARFRQPGGVRRRRGGDCRLLLPAARATQAGGPGNRPGVLHGSMRDAISWGCTSVW